LKGRIQKWGNSLALRLPKVLAGEADLKEGSEVDLMRTKEGVLLRKRRSRDYRLDDLLEKVSAKNIHPETNWGRDTGREVLE
jgi:antitoxin MazE